MAVDAIKAEHTSHDAYLGDGYSMSVLKNFGAPDLPVFDSQSKPRPPVGFQGRLILTPRYGPTRAEMKKQYRNYKLYDPWEAICRS